MRQEKDLLKKKAHNPNSVLLNCIVFRDRKIPERERTLKTAQPGKKHLAKKNQSKGKVVSKVLRDFANGLRKVIVAERRVLLLKLDDQVTKGAGWMPWH